MGIHVGWPKNLAGFQGPFLTSLQALSDPQEGNSGGPCVWASENHTQEIDAQVNTDDALQALACAAMKYKE